MNIKNSNPFYKLKKPILISAYDAGGANHLAALLEKYKPDNVFISVAGPAKKIFKKHVGLKKKKNINFKTVISGTGWQTDWEHQARKQARKNGAFLISLIDHWSNYTNRFSWNEEIIHPDEIWITDLRAYKKCKLVFPGIKRRLVQNCYLKKVLSIIKVINKTTQKKYSILYLTEPIRKSWGNLKKPGEKIAFINFLNANKKNKHEKHLIKIHPSENISQYVKWSKKRSDLVFTKTLTLPDAIAQSKIVCGCYSYALFIAKCAGKKVISAIPKQFEKIKIS